MAAVFTIVAFQNTKIFIQFYDSAETKVRNVLRSTNNYPTKEKPLFLNFHSFSKNKSLTVGLITCTCILKTEEQMNKTIETQMFVYFIKKKVQKIMKNMIMS